MGALEQDHGGRFLTEARNAFRSGPFFARQEAFKPERIGGKAGPRQGGQDSRWARNRHGSDAGRNRAGDQEESGIGDDRRARIGDQRHIGARVQTFEEHSSFLFLVEVMIAGQGRVDAEMRAELFGMTGIFSGDDAHFLEDSYGAERHVLQVSDRGADDVEDAVHGSRAHPSLIGAAQPRRRYAKMPALARGSLGHGPEGSSRAGDWRWDGDRSRDRSGFPPRRGSGGDRFS